MQDAVFEITTTTGTETVIEPVAQSEITTDSLVIDKLDAGPIQPETQPQPQESAQETLHESNMNLINGDISLTSQQPLSPQAGPSQAPQPASQISTPASSAPAVITRTGFVYDMQMMLHCQDGYIPTHDDVIDSGEGHPEEPMRIKRIFARLREAGLIVRMRKLPIQEVTPDQVALVHTLDHWDKVQGTECECISAPSRSLLCLC
jgi:histone deacetylase 6